MSLSATLDETNEKREKTAIIILLVDHNDDDEYKCGEEAETKEERATGSEARFAGPVTHLVYFWIWHLSSVVFLSSQPF